VLARGARAARLARAAEPRRVNAAAHRLGSWSWALFEWARNPYVNLVTVYLFAPYFASTVVGDPVRGQALWGRINGAAGLAIALLSPLLGAIADSGGRRKPWLAGCVAALAAASAALWWAEPAGAGLPIGAVAALLAAGAIAYEFSAVFHNAMLAAIAPRERFGALSGLGLALGNAGSLLLLLALLAATLRGGTAFALDPAAHEPERATGPVVALWLIAFSLPLFRFTPDRERGALPPRAAIRAGVGSLARTLRSLRRHRNVATYLLARMLYNDANNAVLLFGGVYAAGIFGWGAATLAAFGIALSVFAVVGALAGGRLDDALGSKRALSLAIGGTFVGLVAALSITPRHWAFAIPWGEAGTARLWDLPFFATAPELAYLGVAIGIALCVAAAYASSRAMLARLAPPELQAGFFGLYALSGTATAWLAPFAVGAFTSRFASQRAGLASILVFLAAGFAVLRFVREERATAA